MSDPIGSAIGAFGTNSVAPIYYNNQANKNLNWLGKQFQGDNSGYQNALNAFNLANADVTGRMHANSLSAQNDYNNLFQQNATYNPLDTYNTIRSGNLSALKDWSGNLESAGSRQDKLAMQAMGLGGNPNSSYASILRSDRVSQNLAPVLGNIMSSLGSDTATIGNQRAQNLGNLSNLIDLRTNAPMAGYGLQMDPANALMAVRGNQIGQLGNTVDVAKNNTAGFQQKTDTIGKIANSMNGFNDAMWQNIGNAASVYSSLYGGGGGGVKTGSTPAGSNSFNMSAGNGGGGGSAMSMLGGGGNGGGGIDMNTIQSLIKMFQGGQGGGGGGYNYPPNQSYNPWSNYGGTNGTNQYFDTPSYGGGNYA